MTIWLSFGVVTGGITPYHGKEESEKRGYRLILHWVALVCDLPPDNPLQTGGTVAVTTLCLEGFPQDPVTLEAQVLPLDLSCQNFFRKPNTIPQRLRF